MHVLGIGAHFVGNGLVGLKVSVRNSSGGIERRYGSNIFIGNDEGDAADVGAASHFHLYDVGCAAPALAGNLILGHFLAVHLGIEDVSGHLDVAEHLVGLGLEDDLTAAQIDRDFAARVADVVLVGV